MHVSNLIHVICKRRINIQSFSVVYPDTGKIMFVALVATLAAGAAALVYSRRGHTPPPREETAYNPQSSELVTGF